MYDAETKEEKENRAYYLTKIGVDLYYNGLSQLADLILEMRNAIWDELDQESLPRIPHSSQRG